MGTDMPRPGPPWDGKLREALVDAVAEARRHAERAIAQAAAAIGVSRELRASGARRRSLRRDR